MLLNRKGSLHRFMFWLVLIIGFGAALCWPYIHKKVEVKKAREALEGGRKIAAAEMIYFKQNGVYAGDFQLLGKPLTCPLEKKDDAFLLKCADYSYQVKEDKLVIAHNRYKKWFTISLLDGKADCSHEPASLSGAHLCANVNLQ